MAYIKYLLDHFTRKRSPEKATTCYYNYRNNQYIWGQVWTGSTTHVTMDHQETIGAVQRKLQPVIFYHNHPFGIGAYVSQADEMVYQTTMQMLGHPFFVVITDFVTVKMWLYTPQPIRVFKKKYKYQTWAPDIQFNRDWVTKLITKEYFGTLDLFMPPTIKCNYYD